MANQLILAEARGPFTNPLRLGLLAAMVARDVSRRSFGRVTQGAEELSLPPTAESLDLVMDWLIHAQRPDGGISAYYSLLSGYAPSYPETTGYLVPTFYEYAARSGSEAARRAAAAMIRYLLSVQLRCGAFPALTGSTGDPSVFNSGQVIFGLVRSYEETGQQAAIDAARKTGDWLVSVQRSDGRWEGPTYQRRSHTYYTMVAWALARLGAATDDQRYAQAARRNIDWALKHQRPDDWFDGINMKRHPNYLHFVAYIIQGLLECGVLLERPDAVQAASRSAGRLLTMFERSSYLPGAFHPNWSAARRYACLTGNAQMACIWLRLFEITRDPRLLTAARAINGNLRAQLIRRGPRGIRGGVAGSYPIWGGYHPLHYINWGAKFLADALLGELTSTIPTTSMLSARN